MQTKNMTAIILHITLDEGMDFNDQHQINNDEFADKKVMGDFAFAKKWMGWKINVISYLITIFFL